MKPSIIGVSALTVVLLSSFCIAADEAGKAQPAENARALQGAQNAQSASSPERTAKADAKGQPKAVRLTKPWKDLSSLSEDQKKQIADIHKKANQDKQVIEERERADIMALLNDQQKGELKTMLDKEAADRKAKAGNKAAPKSGAAGEKSAQGLGQGAEATQAADEKAAKTKAGDNEANRGEAKPKEANRGATAAPAK